MKKCKYHCDYGDGENCHYTGKSGCVNFESEKKSVSEIYIKVKRGLECCTAWSGLHQCQPIVGSDCPYDEKADCKLELMRDVLELLKEQQKTLRKQQDDIDRLCVEISTLKHQIK